MTLNQILYFQTVARHQHFRLAAAELSISQPSLSRSIAVLEEELGIILFERKGRTVTLTKYGKLFLEHADRILDEVRLAQNAYEETVRECRSCGYRLCLSACRTLYSPYSTQISQYTEK